MLPRCGRLLFVAALILLASYSVPNSGARPVGANDQRRNLQTSYENIPLHYAAGNCKGPFGIWLMDTPCDPGSSGISGGYVNFDLDSQGRVSIYAYVDTTPDP